MRTRKNIAKDLRTFLTDETLRLPRRKPQGEIAALLSAMHARNGGASIHPHFGNLKGQSLFAVSLYPERTVRINGRDIPSEVVLVFLRQNRDLLHDPRSVVGSWYNANEDTTYLDVTVVVGDRMDAMQMGNQYNQIAVYDLEREEEIELGGTGAEKVNGLPEAERLPPWKR